MAGVCLFKKKIFSSCFSMHFHLLQTWHFFPHSAWLFADEVRVFKQIKSVNRFCLTNERRSEEGIRMVLSTPYMCFFKLINYIVFRDVHLEFS